ncbi:MAG: DMT family transporter [Alphaproteobacteria bacterium]|nr:DMT family transporter [Alphaproteobacteria bacterium]
MKLSAIFLALLVVIIWGINPAISKLGLLEIPTFTFLTIRYTIIALIFLPFARPSKIELKQMFVVALTSNVITNILCYAAYAELSPSAASLLLQTEGPISVLMACLWAKEQINFRQVWAILLSFVGVVVILGVPNMSLYGVVAILLSRFFWGGCQIVFKGTKTISISTFLTYSYLFAIPFTAIGSIWWEHYDYSKLATVNWSIAGWVMAFEVIMLSVAIVLWQKLIATNGVNKIAPFSTLRIVFGLLAGVIIFNDDISWQIIVGSILVTWGVVLTMKEFNIVLKARTSSIVVYRQAHHLLMDRKMKRINLRKKRK